MSVQMDTSSTQINLVSHDWLKESSLEETIRFLRKLALVHAQEAGPYQAELEEILHSSDWDRLIGFNVQYERGSADHLYHTRQALAFFQKLEPLPLGVNKEQVAYDKFCEAEVQCRETNRRLRYARRVNWLQPTPRVASILFMAQRKISDILGDVPSLGELNCTFGPGANTSVKASASSARWKLNAKPTCSTELVPALEAVLRCFPSYSLSHRTFKRGLVADLEDHLDNFLVDVAITPGKLQFVPKNAKTYRSIVVEPLLNSLMQKGIGDYISKRLRKAGVDIRTQDKKNKKLAQRASVDGSLATIDLSAASDTISQEVVNELLPLDWVSFLRNFRTGTVEYQGTLITLEKFSSMGNAFTFELETLIFWSLAWACASVERLDASETSSFGDDIILPSGAVSALFDVLSWLGFSINTEKSFWDGPFRESCGGDYVHGIDIRPYYQKDLVSGRTLFVLHNFYVRTLQWDAAALVLAHIPETLRLWGPDGYGDGHLIGTWNHAARRVKRKLAERGYGGVIFDTFTEKTRKIFKPLPIGDRLLPAYSVYTHGEAPQDDPWSYMDLPLISNYFTVRGSSGYRRISIYTLSTGVFLTR